MFEIVRYSFGCAAVTDVFIDHSYFTMKDGLWLVDVVQRKFCKGYGPIFFVIFTSSLFAIRWTCFFFGVHKVSFFFFMGPLGAIKATNVETCYHSINKHKRTFSRTHEPVQQERGRGRGWWAWPGPRSRFYRVVTEFSRWFLLIEPRMAWT